MKKIKRANVEKQIRELLKSCEDVDWGYDSKLGDEVCCVEFNHALATEKILKLIEDLGIEFCNRKG